MFERIKRVIGSATTQVIDSSVERKTDVGPVARFLRGFDMQSGNQTQLSNPYYQHVSVFRCINLIASTVANVPFKLYSGDKEVKSGKEFNLINNPNDVMDWNDLILQLITELLVGGNGYMIIDYDGTTPSRLLPIPWYLMNPVMVAGDEFKILHWERSNGPSRKPTLYAPEDVINIAYAPSTSSRVIGIGPLVAAKIVAEADYAAMMNNLSTLNGGGLPAGILKFIGAGRLTEEMRNEIADSWRNTFNGPKSGSRLAVINQDWSWQATGATNAEMETTSSREWNLADICRAFNIPKLYLFEQERGAVGDATIRTHQKMFYYNNIIPLTRRLERRLNNRLIFKMNKNLIGKFDFEEVEALREDFNKKVETAQVLIRMGFSPNSVNHIMGLGMDDMPWGDDFLAPMNLVPAQDIVDHEVVAPGGNDKIAGIGSDQMGPAEKTPPVKKVPPKQDPAKKAATLQYVECWDSSTGLVDDLYDLCKNKAQRLLSLDRTKIIAGHATSFNASVLADGILPFTVRAYVSGYLSVVNQDEIAVRKLAAVYADSRYNDIVLFSESLSELLKIKNWDMDEGKHKRKLINRIIRKIGDLCKTEVFRAFNSGRYVAMSDSRVERGVWIGSPSTECPDSCNHGDIRTIGDTYSTGHRYPGDDSMIATVGCDCIICPVIGQ